MRFYEIVVEQLDLAAELLQERHPMKSRLALILVDNATEYALHLFAKDYFDRNAYLGHGPIPERREHYRKQAKVCGNHIKPKIAFARCQNAITEDQALYVRKAHEFRNQAYHAGKAYDPIITELVAAYYSVICGMLPGLAPRMMTSNGGSKLSPRVERHMKNTVPRLPIPAAKPIADSLLHALPQPGLDLADACQIALTKWLAEINSIVDYLVRNDTTVDTAESLILEVQYWSDYWAEAPPGGLVFRDDGSGNISVDPDQKEDLAKLQVQMQGWKPRVSERTLGRWEERTAELNGTTLPGVLLQKYCTLVSEIEPFKAMISRRCAAFDQHVEVLMNAERDKEPRKRLRGEDT